MSNYHERVLEGRKQFLRLVIEQEKELLSIYEEVAKQVAYKLSKAKPAGLTVRYLSELDKIINEYIDELRSNVVETIKDGIEASSQIASAIQLSYFENIDPREDILATFNKMFNRLPTSIVKQLISGSYYADGKTLNNRIWDLTSKNSKDIDRLIKINVAKGVNARELAKQLDAYINPTKKIDAKTLEAGMNKNISYQAQRLSRTSLTHAHNETYIQGSKMNPFCRGLKWNLSPSHYERQVKKWGQDICDEYATRDSYSRGQGVYPADKYPVAHPNCLCYPTQENAPVERAREEIIKWLNGGSNTLLDQWSDKYGEEFGIERNKSKAFSEIAASKGENSGIIKEEMLQREMANGQRKSAKIALSNEDKEHLLNEINLIKADKGVFVFRDGFGSGYSDERDIVFVSSNIFPSGDDSLHPRDLMSERAALAHEYYGHRAYRNTTAPKGSWQDEFRASYMAAKSCPNLSDEDRINLILDAIERARESGVSIKYNDFMRRILYGY